MSFQQQKHLCHRLGGGGGERDEILKVKFSVMISVYLRLIHISVSLKNYIGQGVWQ